MGQNAAQSRQKSGLRNTRRYCFSRSMRAGIGMRPLGFFSTETQKTKPDGEALGGQRATHLPTNWPRGFPRSGFLWELAADFVPTTNFEKTCGKILTH